ncbi:MAG TPA: hypothetical protein VFQ41_23630 [Candidatus Angelobacter sp.]|nr:hypothetical protein [Candidatus Angelobacter sp.]
MSKKTVCLCAFIVLLAGTSFAGVSVQSPSATSVTSPVHFVATATSTHPITAMRIYVDGISVFNNTSASLDTLVTIAPGQHSTVVQAWDSTGTVFKNTMILTVVSSSSPTPTPTPSASPTPSTAPSGATVKSDIDQMPGWESCTVCAGANAAGPSATYSMTENVLSPALDGKAAQFNIGGSTPYSDALWWKQLGGNNAIKNFTYDVNFYITNSAAPQALEFDVNQSNNIYKFIFGTQCNIKDGAQWDVWGNASGNWIHTGIPCTAPAAYTWHHLTWQFQRTATQVSYVSFTYDGVTHYVNRTYPAGPNNVSEINVAFQMDGDSKQTAYSTWLDKVSLTYW